MTSLLPVLTVCLFPPKQTLINLPDVHFTSFTDRQSAPVVARCFFPVAVTSQDDVIESADPAEPLAKRLADSGVGHVAGELAEAGVERRLERQEGGVGQEEDLVQEGQDHVGPRLYLSLRVPQ